MIQVLAGTFLRLDEVYLPTKLEMENTVGFAVLTLLGEWISGIGMEAKRGKHGLDPIPSLRYDTRTYSSAPETAINDIG
ncbi:hypothetical protein BOTCAL_0022g00240 [Botryotinia calthae]|uniref:Uncharacterized protein n=1 Tax=Botryotinia calthae TaxID=38488 RepID=A0A4Y8DEN4_9HELO|nr:hypothetical protein BOTCAL_0022g00240 [Botryotinia calthae]